jgi:hypothetical protein
MVCVYQTMWRGNFAQVMYFDTIVHATVIGDGWSSSMKFPIPSVDVEATVTEALFGPISLQPGDTLNITWTMELLQ